MAVSAFTVANIKPSLGIDANQRFIFGLEEAPEPLGSFKLDNNFTPIIGTPSQTNAEVRNKAFSGYRWIHTTTSTDTYGTYKLQKFLTASPTGVDIMTFNNDGTFIIPGVANAAAKYILQTADADLPNAQSLGALTTGLLKNTVGGITGVLSTSTPGVDYYAPNFPTRLIDDFTDNIDPLAAYGNLGVGLKALDSLTLESPTDTLNVAIGPEALYSFTTGAGNTTVGALAGVKLVTATGNTITGVSLVNLTAGDHNTISGYAIGNTLTTANRNCFFGSQIALGMLGITSLEDCCFIGFQAGTATSGITEAIAIGTTARVENKGIAIGVLTEAAEDSVCIGWHSNSDSESVVVGNEGQTSDQRCVVVGHTANSTGAYGVAVGWSASSFGSNATAVGDSSGANGIDSIAVGSEAAANGNESIAIGKLSKANDSTGTGAVALGKGARADANNAIAIGKDVIVTTANSMALGNGVNVGIGTFAPAYRLDVFPTGGITFNANAGRIIGVATPSAGTDAANKAYVDSSGVAIANAQFIIRVSDPDLPNAQILGSLATGIVKNTTTTGVLSIAIAGTDYYSLNNPTKLIDSGGSPNNVAMGRNALNHGSFSGSGNHVFGNSGQNITTGSFNHIFGSTATLLSGSSNIIMGSLAADQMGIANENVVIGEQSGRNITGSSQNTFVGTESGRGLQSGTGFNVGIGYRAGYNSGVSSSLMDNCVFIGANAIHTGASLTNAVAIGSGAQVAISNSMVLGANLNVGIGTSSPSQAKLVVSGGVTNVASEFSVIRATGNNNATKIEIERSGGSGKLYELRSDDAGAYSIFDRTAAASRMFINTSGNIGINMTSSILAKFHVTGGVQNIASEDTCIRATSSSNSAKIEIQCTNGSGKLYEIHSANSGGLHVYDRTGNASRMFINTNGLVGINTFTATNAQFTVSGGVQNVVNEDSIIRAVSAATVAKIELQCTNGSGRLYEFRSGNDGFLSIVDRTGVAPRIVINTSGQIGIGGLTAPHAPLQFPNVVTNRQLVLYEAANNNFQFHGFGSISGGLGYNINDVGDSHVFFAGVNTTTRNEVARFTGTGDCVIADTFYGKRPSGTCYMQANATATAVTAGTWTKVAGTTSSGSLNKFTMPADNRLQYTDTRTVTAFVIASVTASHNVALGSLIGFSIFKNGVQVVPSAMFNQDPLSTSRSATCITLVSLATNDYIEVFCNSSANANITVSHLTIDVTTT